MRERLPEAAESVSDPESTIVGEVICRGYPGLSRALVTACVRQAFLDLAGSVSPESLPEMAARLAGHRLDAASRNGLSPR